MAIRPLTVPLPMAVSAGTGYAATYLKGKQEILKERLKWADAELKQKYASEVAYEKDKEAAFAGVEAELNALRKEREEFAASLAAAAAKGGRGGTDWRTTLLQERTKISETIAQETTKVSGIKAELLKTVQDTYTPPPGALDQATKAAQTRGAVSSPQTIDAGIDAYIGSPELATAFGGLSQGQKQALAIHAYREMEQQIGVVQQGVPMTTAQAAKIKQAIADKFGIRVEDQDSQVLEEDKKAFQDDVMSKAGTSLAAAQKALKYIEDQLAIEGTGPGTDSQMVSETEIGLRTLAIQAYKNDGRIDGGEALKAEQLVNSKITQISGAVEGTPEFETAKRLLNRKLNFMNPEGSFDLTNYALTNIDDPTLQTYIREGELTQRKEALINQRITDLTGLKPGDAGFDEQKAAIGAGYALPRQIAAPTADDVKRRGAELYYPDRSQRGFGKTAPFYSSETAKARRAFEQGQDMNDPALGTSRRYDAPPGPDSRFGPKEGAKGRRAPVTSFYGAAADELMGHTRAAREAIAANGGKFVPETIDGPAGEIYNDISERYKRGELKFDDLYDEVSGSTTNSADMTATLGGADAAKETKRKVLYNVLGSAYEQFLNNAPKQEIKPKMPDDYGDYANE
jgi:hypothetical protein